MIMQCAYIENKSETTTAGLWNFFIATCNWLMIMWTEFKTQWPITSNITSPKLSGRTRLPSVSVHEHTVYKISCLLSFPRLERHMTVIFRKKISTLFISLSTFCPFYNRLAREVYGIGKFYGVIDNKRYENRINSKKISYLVRYIYYIYICNLVL